MASVPSELSSVPTIRQRPVMPEDRIDARVMALAGPPERMELGLARMLAAMAALAIPQRQPWPVILVAGTNGKGSTVAYLESLYRQVGYRVAAYTSPHVWRFVERLRIDGGVLAEARWLAALEQVTEAAGHIPLTYFELATLAALLLVGTARPDLLILEVGMGGRLDAVNAVHPDLSIITTVAMDHQQWLGDTRAAIGREKAGILRAGVPVLYGDASDPCASVLAAAELSGSPLCLLGRDLVVDSTAREWRMERQRWRIPEPPWGGREQWDNLALAVAATWLLRGRLPAAAQEPGSDWRLRPQLPGRGQFLRPWGEDGPGLLLDVAHNPQATGRLAELLRRHGPGRVHVLFNLLADKDLEGCLRPLVGMAGRWYPVALPESSRTRPWPRLLADLEALGLPVQTVEEGDFCASLEAARRGLGPDDLVLCFGSFQVLAQVPQDLLPADTGAGVTTCPIG